MIRKQQTLDNYLINSIYNSLLQLWVPTHTYCRDALGHWGSTIDTGALTMGGFLINWWTFGFNIDVD